MLLYLLHVVARALCTMQIYLMMLTGPAHRNLWNATYLYFSCIPFRRPGATASTHYESIVTVTGSQQSMIASPELLRSKISTT